MAGEKTVRAAQYLRMSTEHQNYSIEHQAAANAAYARERGYEIVRTYADAGVSGLELKRRAALKQLLADVLSGAAEFHVILVYDVSRWGRFQDPDESAHYEFLCRSTGVSIEYTTEPFANDGGVAATLVKHLKRAMAAEYSRELSAKVATAQRRLSEKGYWRGGPCGYGFRRRAIACDGAPGPVMAQGEHKALHGYRTVLTRGPDEEVATVRRIFGLFVVHGLSTRGVARLLNTEGRRTPGGGPWTTSGVRRVLTTEKYVGTLVIGRRTSRLKQVKAVPPDQWIRVSEACPALVERRLFDIAQANLRPRKAVGSDAELIDELRALLRRHGRLSSDIIHRDPQAHCPAVYIKRFGGLVAAYALAGFEPSRTQIAAAARVARFKPHLARPRARQWSTRAMLRGLRQLLEREGRLSSELIDSARGLPSSSRYRARFGGLSSAYKRAGYMPSRRQANAFVTNGRRPKP